MNSPKKNKSEWLFVKSKQKIVKKLEQELSRNIKKEKVDTM